MGKIKEIETTACDGNAGDLNDIVCFTKHDRVQQHLVFDVIFNSALEMKWKKRKEMKLKPIEWN